MPLAAGSFELKLSPESPTGDATIARYSIDRNFSGDLQARSRVEMLGTQFPETYSGVFVAIERITGSLGGRSGAFSLYHTRIMNRGVPTLTAAVVPDSGTEALVGLTGSMKIIMEKERQSYEFDYALPG